MYSIVNEQTAKMTEFQSIDKVLHFLKLNSIPYKENFLLRYETYYKAGGSAKLFVEPSCKSQIVRLIGYLKSEDIGYKVIGLTSNIYFLDELTYGVIISTRSLRQLEVQGLTIDVESGYQLESLVRVALIHNATGFEGLEGIPGSIGGGILMNAGAYGYCISDNLLSVTVVDKEGSIKEISKDDCKFSHRSSVFKESQSFVIISAKFKLINGDKDKIASKIRTYHIARHSYQEFAYPNLGSLFSVNGDFYREIFRLNRFYRNYCFILKALLRNSFAKMLMRRNPNNLKFNKLVIDYIKSPDILTPVSEKSLNILINDGSSGFIDRIRHVYVIKKYLKDSTPIENEFITAPIMNESVNIEFMKELRKLCKTTPEVADVSPVQHTQ